MPRARRRAYRRELPDPVFLVTVSREISGTPTRVFEYAGDPHADEIQPLLEHITQLVAVDRRGTLVEVACSGAPARPEIIQLADVLRALQPRNVPSISGGAPYGNSSREPRRMRGPAATGGVAAFLLYRH